MASCVLAGKGDSLSTVREDYANYELWLDWKIGPKGDSGVYLRGQPQVQIWDPRGDDNPVAASGSGALFNNKKALNEPLVKADRITGDWNRFRILMIEDRVHVYLNGQLVKTRHWKTTGKRVSHCRGRGRLNCRPTAVRWLSGTFTCERSKKPTNRRSFLQAGAAMAFPYVGKVPGPMKNLTSESWVLPVGAVAICAESPR